MSRLTDKYQSYAHFKGTSFDESTYTANPTKTGAKLWNGNPVVMGSYTSDGANNPTILTGVMPNQKCYELEFDSTVTPNKNVRLIYGSTTVGVAGGLDDVRRLIWDEESFDRVVGFWLKMPSSFPVNNGSLPLHRWLRGTAALINIGPGKTNNNPAIYIIHGSELASPSISNYTSYVDQNSNVIPLEWDKWYFVAVRKRVIYNTPVSVDTAATGTIEFQHYINGELVNTITNTSWTKRGCNGIVWGNNAAPAGGQFKTAMSSWFIADWSDIGQTQLRDIYDYGAPIQTPIKYWDGDSWENSTGSKVYYDGAWRDIYASRWTGTEWLPL